MTVTTAAPDTTTPGAVAPDDGARERWERLQDQLVQVGLRMLRESDVAVAALDARLARLDTLRQELADLNKGEPPFREGGGSPDRGAC
ncbi:hypothetical protein ACIRPK_29040 [Kitasatospora sp. NPDC101801]|uniref:hypothetical protein n=1 Tax=Kitasatospora sp. NPDC101801 TaxID=3364103 RepID=UPI00380748E4